MIIILLLAALLLTCIAPILLHKKGQLLITVTQCLMLILIVVVSLHPVSQYQTNTHSFTFVDFNGIALNLSIQFDMLTKIMMIFILVIGTLIYRYAQNYLESDNTRLRFLSQFNLVLLSVLLLAMSANLLTTFVAWQLISINLYMLLNHYHYDPAANKAAKKKFVISRVGDCSFLLAIILAYYTENSTSFAAIAASPHAELICGLLFISVMTKCAQFPFHIWLIDTMETPTPVSALMHAGVINAGGILLTRVSSALVQFHSLAYVILLLGLTSAVLSIHWMNQQPDTKKQLAYSTMGQMGYMLMQCGLGAFTAAVFHLMSHGFYKASLFLNAGETLGNKQTKHTEKISHLLLLKSIIIAAIVIFVGLLIFKEQTRHIPLLMYGFIFLTLTTLVIKIDLASKPYGPMRLFYYVMIGLLYLAYLYVFLSLSRLLPQYEKLGTVSWLFQLIVFAALLCLQYYLWRKNDNNITERFKDRTEQFLRCFLLNPLRSLGNVINIPRYQKITLALYISVMVITVVGFCYGLFHYAAASQTNIAFNQESIFIFLLVGIVTLTIANRCLSIKLLIIYLILFEVAFTNIALFDNNINIAKIGLFHIINISTVLLMLVLLAKKNNADDFVTKNTNRFSARVFYLVFSLLLLIGIPGTASFISEFYLFNALMHSSLLLTCMYIVLIILIAIVVMHSLQLYAFNRNYSALLLQPIRKKHQVIFLAIIAFNFLCGIFPNIVLNYL